MGNVVRLPMNVPYARISLLPGTNKAGQSSEHDELPADANLLAYLAFVRDRLLDASDTMDSDSHQACLNAVDGAFNTAMGMERKIINQTLHIEDMARVACTDPLTNVYNRRGFEQEFNRALSAASRLQETGLLVFIDLDGFKPINDTYGHAAGDQVLTEVARALQEHTRAQDLVARIGGDEFTVLLTRTTWEDGLKRAEHLKHILNTMYVRWNDKNIAVRASLGFQRFGADADAEILLSKADSAMYEAKRLRSTEGNADRRTDD